MNKNLRLILLAATPLVVLAAILAAVFLLRPEPEPEPVETVTTGEPAEVEMPAGEEEPQLDGQSAVIDEIAEKSESECGEYAVVARYAVTYALCEKDGLKFRVDDVSAASEAQLDRLRAAMHFRCADLAGQGLRINNLSSEAAIISAYLVADREDYPDLRLIQVALGRADYEIQLENICDSFSPAANTWQETEDDSELADVAAALAAAGATNCAETAWRSSQFGYASLICDNEDEAGWRMISSSPISPRRTRSCWTLWPTA